MGQGYKAIPDDSVAIPTALKSVQKRLNTQETPTGTQLQNLVAQVKATLANINTQVAIAVAANSYTQAQIDTKDANTLASAEAFAEAGFTGSGGISMADLYTRNGPGFNITATRVAGWLQSADGRIGTATSSIEFKTAIQDLPADAFDALLDVGVHYFEYKAEVARRDDPTSPDYVGPDYHVGTNVGVMAEDLHNAGLWAFVVYERTVVTDDDGNPVGMTLKLDDNGEPIPNAVHDALLGYALLVVVQHINTRLVAVETAVGIGNQS